MQEIQERQPNETSSMGLIMSVDQGQATKEIAAINQFQGLINSQLKKDQDYGVIPGTQKPTLLKPGAEKILMLLGLKSEYQVVDKVEDFDRGFFAYTVQASLYHGSDLITQGLGAANTKETRYRKNNFNKQTHKKDPWDGVSYQDPYTLQNTVLKMAKKRAQVDATLTVGSLSNVFTQDVEDMKDFNQRETTETMNNGDANTMKITFGKYKGRTIGDVVQSDRSYLEWLEKNAKDASMRQAVAMILHGQNNQAPQPQAPTQHQQSSQQSESQQTQTQRQTPPSTNQHQAGSYNGMPPAPSDADEPPFSF
ncbi:hypothetical protein [Lacticaseibacillus paracasei]|uniref:exodeoxyribonuclease X C-terminal domain-containing protein n=1 Tax=Lacticaseibacillus paracasei TaxID=1597 RepID=UPI00346708DB